MPSIQARASRGQRRRRALGSTFLDDLVQGIKDTAEQGATTWLVSQYSALRQLPTTITLLERRIDAIRRLVRGNLQTGADPMQKEAIELAQLRAEYPSMISAVDAAYQVTREGFKGDASTRDVLSSAVPAIATAKSFASRVAAVDSAVNTVIRRLQDAGTITAEQAAEIQAAQPKTAAWVPWVIGGVAVVGGVWVLSRLFRKKGRR